MASHRPTTRSVKTLGSGYFDSVNFGRWSSVLPEGLVVSTTTTQTLLATTSTSLATLATATSTSLATQLTASASLGTVSTAVYNSPVDAAVRNTLSDLILDLEDVEEAFDEVVSDATAFVSRAEAYGDEYGAVSDALSNSAHTLTTTLSTGLASVSDAVSDVSHAYGLVSNQHGTTSTTIQAMETERSRITSLVLSPDGETASEFGTISTHYDTVFKPLVGEVASDVTVASVSVVSGWPTLAGRVVADLFTTSSSSSSSTVAHTANVLYGLNGRVSSLVTGWGLQWDAEQYASVATTATDARPLQPVWQPDDVETDASFREVGFSTVVAFHEPAPVGGEDAPLARYVGASASFGPTGSVLVMGSSRELGADDVEAGGALYMWEYDSASSSFQPAAGLTTPVRGSNMDEEVGSAVAVGTDICVVGNPGYSENRGRVLIFEKSGSPAEWAMTASTLGENETDAKFGTGVAVSSDGSRFAASSPLYSGVGRVYVYDLLGDPVEWTESAILFATEASGDGVGQEVVMSSDGTVVGAVGTTSGRVYVADYNADEDEWVPRTELQILPEGTIVSHYPGLAMSGDGARVAVTAQFDDATTTLRVFVYRYDPGFSSGTWVQELSASHALSSALPQVRKSKPVAMSPDGRYLAFGTVSDGTWVLQRDEDTNEWSVLSDPSTDEAMAESLAGLALTDGLWLATVTHRSSDNGDFRVFRRRTMLPFPETVVTNLGQKPSG